MVDTANVSLAGITVAMVTPVTADGSLDEAGLDRLLDHTSIEGVVGLSPCGSTGEGARLSRDERVVVVRRVVAAAGDRAVLAGVPGGPGRDVVDELRTVADAGVQAALLAPPGHNPLVGSEVLRWYSRVVDASPIPLVLYNIPAMTGVTIPPEVAGELAGHERVLGLKDSSRDMEYLRQVVRRCAGQSFEVLTGTDTLLAESLAAGAVGAVVASACVAPQLATGIYRAWLAGDIALARDLQDHVLDLVSACRAGRFPAGWKAGTEAAGVCGRSPVPPGEELDGPALERIRSVVSALPREVVAHAG